MIEREGVLTLLLHSFGGLRLRENRCRAKRPGDVKRLDGEIWDISFQVTFLCRELIAYIDASVCNTLHLQND